MILVFSESNHSIATNSNISRFVVYLMGHFTAFQKIVEKLPLAILKAHTQTPIFGGSSLKVHTHTPILARSGQEPAVESADSITESADSTTDSILIGRLPVLNMFILIF